MGVTISCFVHIAPFVILADLAMVFQPYHQHFIYVKYYEQHTENE